MAHTFAARTLRGWVAVIGIGETEYYRHGASPDPEFKLALKAYKPAHAAFRLPLVFRY
jgi:predicted N-acetyltransferase YhbS